KRYAVDPDPVNDHPEITQGGEVREEQRPPRRDRRLIDDAKDREEEEPALLRTARVDRQSVEPEVERQERHAEVEVILQVGVEEVQQVPGDGAVQRQRADQPEVRAPVDRAKDQ